MSEYPKWVQRAPHIGAVLCLTSEEEKALIEDWENLAVKEAEDKLAKALAEAEAAEAEATLAVKTVDDEGDTLLLKKRK